MPLRNSLFQRFRHQETGFALVYTLITMPVTVMIAVFAVDVGAIYMMRDRLQITADAAALAGAAMLPVDARTAPSLRVPT
jgi:Flp pilus assembly protein TadG